MTTAIRHVFVINSGSSSLKFTLFDLSTETVLASGIAERLNTKEASLTFAQPDRTKQTESLPKDQTDHRAALRRIIGLLATQGPFDVQAVGHRVVHGGEDFRQATLVTPSVLSRIESLADLAPLHNPPAAQGIRLTAELFPSIPQVAVFDTAFHQTLPSFAFHYALPLDLYRKYRIRRYGFHGTSHQYVAQQAAARLDKPLESLHLLTAHLGNGCSAAAIRSGQSVDTTMGLTPLEGLVMGTRSGDVDPNLHLFLKEKEHLSVEDVTDLLTRKSGLLGVSDRSQDMRTILEAVNQGDGNARLAVELFCYRLARGLLGLTAGLERVDALVFTGGIGENSAFVRARTLEHLALLRPDLVPEWNEENGEPQNGRITREPGLVCLVIPTNEELMIARQTAEVAAKKLEKKIDDGAENRSA